MSIQFSHTPLFLCSSRLWLIQKFTNYWVIGSQKYNMFLQLNSVLEVEKDLVVKKDLCEKWE